MHQIKMFLGSLRFPFKMSSLNRLGWKTKYSYGVGHVFNDLCASMWFSYLLIFFIYVLEFPSGQAGMVLLIGQLADGFSTPIVGIFSDKENKIPACANYGRRKVWHLMGTIFVFVSFPFIFSPCFGCQYAASNKQLIYYCFFIIVFQFGWACVQISHLSLIPELTSNKHIRTELNSIRYAFTVLSNLSVYTVAFFLFRVDDSSTGDKTPSQNSTSLATSSTTFSTGPPETSTITSDNANDFRNIALFCIAVGAFFSIIFHIGVKEPAFRNPHKKHKEAIEAVGQAHDLPPIPAGHKSMSKFDWFKEITFYQVAVLYMATRLYVNLYQVYVPLYVQKTLKLNSTAIATVPFTMYLAGFAGSLVMKKVNRKIGRKGTFSCGCLFGLSACIWIAFGSSTAYATWGIYCVSSLLGIGGSTVLITSLSITADLIGNNVEGGAFVYGFMSLVDKISNGIVIMLIQNAYNYNDYFYQHVLTYACGSACILGIIVCVTLIPVKVGKRRGMSNVIATLVEESDDSDSNKSVLGADFQSEISTISNGHLS